MQESSLVNLGNTYQEGLYQNERARADSLQAVRTEIAAMLASGQISQDEANALYAGIAGGSYDVAAPEVQGGGYYEPSYTYFVPYADAQTQDPLAPSMTDAEMYAMLNGLSLPDSLIDTYFTPGQAAPTYQQIVDEYAQRNAPKQVQGGGGNRNKTYPIETVDAMMQRIPVQDQLSADAYGQVSKIAQLPNEQQRLNAVVNLAGTGRYRDEEIANMLYVLGLR
jgi:hypothetical protein